MGRAGRAHVGARIDRLRGRREVIDPKAARTELAAGFAVAEDVAFRRADTAIHAVGPRLRARAVGRVAGVVAGVWIAVTGLVYGLAVVIRPPALAADWARTDVVTVPLHVTGWAIGVPVAPYLQVAALLGAVAGVGFLGLVLTDQQHFAAFAGAVVARPAEDCLRLARPYLAPAEPMTPTAPRDPRRVPGRRLRQALP